MFRPFDLAERQLAGVDAWHAGRRLQQEAAAAGRRSREQRLGLARRMDVLREQHRAIIARTDAQLKASADLLRGAPARAVVVHRNAWFADRVGSALTGHGAELVACLANGAAAVGVAVAEQPELLLLEETLPMLGGADLVREILAYSPRSLIAVQVTYETGIATLRKAGARATYGRRVPPAEVAAAMMTLLEQRPA